MIDGSPEGASTNPKIEAETELQKNITVTVSRLKTLLNELPKESRLNPETTEALSTLQLDIERALTIAPQQSQEETKTEIDIENHPAVKAAVEKSPREAVAIIEVVKLYCDPRLHNCDFKEGKVYYTDPRTGERKELKQLSDTTPGRGTGSQRVIFEGPTEDTVIKLAPKGFAGQSHEELGCYLEANSDQKRNLVRIFGFRRAPIGEKNDSLVLLEERVSPISAGEKRKDKLDLKYDIERAERFPNSYTEAEIAGPYGLQTLAQLKDLSATCIWGEQYDLYDANLNNIGLTGDGRLVYHDFGARRKSSELSYLFSEYSDINFEAIRTGK